MFLRFGTANKGINQSHCAEQTHSIESCRTEKPEMSSHFFRFTCLKVNSFFEEFLVRCMKQSLWLTHILTSCSTSMLVNTRLVNFVAFKKGGC